MRRIAVLAPLLMSIVATVCADPGDQFGQMGRTICKGPHLRFSPARAATSVDEAKARSLLADLRKALTPYADARRAIEAGYVPFLPDVPQDVYHFSNAAFTQSEYLGEFSATHPGSLLYRKRDDGAFELVGAMYSAPGPSTDAELNARIPLSVTHWHAHVNVCLPNGITLDDLVRGDFGASGAPLAGRLPESGPRARLNRMLNRRYGFMADGRFGFEGSIAERSICEAAGGNFIAQAWGWMAHVYPFAGDDLKLAYGQALPSRLPTSDR